MIPFFAIQISRRTKTLAIGYHKFKPISQQKCHHFKVHVPRRRSTHHRPNPTMTLICRVRWALTPPWMAMDPSWKAMHRCHSIWMSSIAVHLHCPQIIVKTIQFKSYSSRIRTISMALRSIRRLQHRWATIHRHRISQLQYLRHHHQLRWRTCRLAIQTTVPTWCHRRLPFRLRSTSHRAFHFRQLRTPTVTRRGTGMRRSRRHTHRRHSTAGRITMRICWMTSWRRTSDKSQIPVI